MQGGERSEEVFLGEHTTIDDGDEDVRQGDVLDLIPGLEDPGEWASHFGVVLTANCDLVHGKHGGVLSYIPVVPLEVYVCQITVPSMIDAEHTKARKALRSELPLQDGWPKFDRLVNMLNVGRQLEVAEQSLPEAGATANVVQLLRRLDACIGAAASATNSLTLHESLRVVEELRSRIRTLNGAAPLPAYKALIEDLQGRLSRSLPGDSLFIGSLSDNHQDGYVAYLRLIREIRHDSIARSAVHERKLGTAARARRVSRLQLLFQHRIAQQMSHVFADIGLPADYEDAWSESVANSAGRWHDELTKPQDHDDSEDSENQ